MKKIDLHAAAQLAIGALEKLAAETAPGHHDLSGGELLVAFPAFAAVSRAEGTAGGGYNAMKARPLELNPHAVLLFLERIRKHLPPAILREAQQLWFECIYDTERGTMADMPPEAAAALAQYGKDYPAEQPDPRKTPAKRIGTEECTVTVRRRPKTEAHRATRAAT